MEFMDLELARRLEMASAISGKRCAECTQELRPELGAVADHIAGGIAVYAGVDSPVTQALGVGLQGEVSARELDRLEEFFFSRRADSALEICPLAGIPLYEALANREYRLLEVSSVLARPLTTADDFHYASTGVTIAIATSADEILFTHTVAQGFAGHQPVTHAILDVMRGFFRTPNTISFLAFENGAAAGGASLFTIDGVAGMFGASTLPAHRGRGVQQSLLAARLAWAAGHGCDVAKGITLPGSSSQRNHERFGFRVAYTRTKLVLKCA